MLVCSAAIAKSAAPSPSSRWAEWLLSTNTSEGDKPKNYMTRCCLRSITLKFAIQRVIPYYTLYFKGDNRVLIVRFWICLHIAPAQLLGTLSDGSRRISGEFVKRATFAKNSKVTLFKCLVDYSFLCRRCKANNGCCSKPSLGYSCWNRSYSWSKKGISSSISHTPKTRQAPAWA